MKLKKHLLLLLSMLKTSVVLNILCNIVDLNDCRPLLNVSLLNKSIKKTIDPKPLNNYIYSSSFFLFFSVLFVLFDIDTCHDARAEGNRLRRGSTCR